MHFHHNLMALRHLDCILKNYLLSLLAKVSEPFIGNLLITQINILFLLPFDHFMVLNSETIAIKYCILQTSLSMSLIA